MSPTHPDDRLRTPAPPGTIALDALPGSAAVVDRDGVIVDVNSAWLAFAVRNGGDPARTGPGASYLDVSDAETVAGLRAVLDGRAGRYESDYPCHTPTEDAWFRITITPAAEGALVLHLDTTEDHRRLRRILHGAAGGIVEIAEDGTASWCNEGWSRLAGTPHTDPTSWLSTVSPDDQHAVRIHIATALRRKESFSVDVRTNDDRPETRWLRLVGRPTRDGGHAALIITALDVTDERLHRNELTHLAYHDALTGLANRALFVEHLHTAVATLERPSESPGVGVLFIDLDDFKAINDAHGHERGDDALQLAATRFRQVVRPGDIVARFGGDEFVVLLHDVTVEETVEVGERIRVALAARPSEGDRGLALTASVGAVHVNRSIRADELLGASDQALYDAKGAGKNRVRLLDI